jgi:hypothetical protein
MKWRGYASAIWSVVRAALLIDLVLLILAALLPVLIGTLIQGIVRLNSAGK